MTVGVQYYIASTVIAEQSRAEGGEGEREERSPLIFLKS